MQVTIAIANAHPCILMPKRVGFVHEICAKHDDVCIYRT